MSRTAQHLYLMRHGPTEWNSANRIQGRTDVPLSDYGRQIVLSRQLPEQAKDAQWFSSPLKRARETARLMQLEPTTEPALTEISYGAWEGQFVDDEELLKIRRKNGWDGRPPGGETRREAFSRIEKWLTEEHAKGTRGDIGAVVHGGLIKTIYAYVTGWAMTDEPNISFLVCAGRIQCREHGSRLCLALRPRSLKPIRQILFGVANRLRRQKTIEYNPAFPAPIPLCNFFTNCPETHFQKSRFSKLTSVECVTADTANIAHH